MASASPSVTRLDGGEHLEQCVLVRCDAVRQIAWRDADHTVAGVLELRRRGTVHVADRHGEGDEGGRHIEVFEGAGHGILAANGADPEVHLRHEGAEHGRKRFAPALRLVAQLLEILPR